MLVDNRTSLALQVNPQKLPTDPGERRRELARLGQLTHSSLRKVRRTLREGIKVSGTAPVTLRQDVGHTLVYYLQENRTEFPGVEIASVYIRRYPKATLAAHLVGSVGEINSKELKEPRYRGLKPGDVIGKGGVEYSYDRYLRGLPGLIKNQVDSLGVPTPGGQLSNTPPQPGDNLKLTIDPTVQAAGEAALAARGLPGGFVTMNVHNGQILGMGSYPTFDPTVFTHPMTQSQVNALFRDPVSAPLTDRASQGLYPTGSTFKLITSMAALNSGVITPSTTIYDGGVLTVGGESFQNAGGASYGALTLVPALQVSSDVFFYTLGLKMWDTGRPAAVGAHARDRAPHRARPSRTGGRAAADPAVAQPALQEGPDRPAMVCRATTSSSPPGRPTCRPTRCRWRSPTPRSATAAPWLRPTSAWRSMTRRAASCRRSTPGRGATSTSSPSTAR